MALSIPLQFALVSGISLVSGVVFLVMARRQPHTHLLRYWGFGALLLSAANAAFASRHTAPEFVYIVMANALLQAALVTLHAGVRRLDGGLAGGFDVVGWTTVTTTITLVVWFTYFDPVFAVRLIIVASASAILIARIAWRLSLHSRRMGGSLPANVLAGLCWLLEAILIITVLATVIYGERAGDLLEAGPQMTSLLAVRPFLLVLIACSAIWMALQAIHKESHDHAQHDLNAIKAGRTAYEMHCGREIAQHGNTPLSVALIDLDNYRVVRRQHGLPATDALLEWTIGVIRGALKDGQSAERHGPDRFVVTLPQTSAAEAVILAENIRKRIEAGTCMVDGAAIKTTASIGIAHLQAERSTPATLAAAAHVALYKARSAGRNRVETAEDAFPTIDYAKL